jgi:hypothetical protein
MAAEILVFSQIHPLRLIGFYEPSYPPLMELAAIFSGMIVALYLIYLFIGYFTTNFSFKVPLKVLTDEDRPVPVSPFLFSEDQLGDVRFSAKKNKLLLQIVAIILILFLLIIPMGELLLPPESFFYFF